MITDFKLTGTILWISKRDGNGILLAKYDNKEYEIYFDKSVFLDFEIAKPKDNVYFSYVKTGGCNCGRDLELI